MVITNPELPPKRGYVEVEVDGRRTYRNIETGLLIEEEPEIQPEPTEPSVWDELDAAYQEGVNAAYDE